jgi:hypothetical protein
MKVRTLRAQLVPCGTIEFAVNVRELQKRLSDIPRPHCGQKLVEFSEHCGWGHAQSRVGTTMTIAQIIILVLMPSMAVVAVLFCKPAFRRRLALHPQDKPDLATDPIAQFAE